MTSSPRFADLAVGQPLPPVVKAIDRAQIAAFAEASGDRNPIHLDEEAARANRLPGVIAHGMLNMAFLAQVLTHWVAQPAIRSFSTRFLSVTVPGDAVTCRAVVAAKTTEEGENRISLDLVAENQKGETVLAGSAVVALT